MSELTEHNKTRISIQYCSNPPSPFSSPFQIFHGVWTIAFFCLNVLDTRAVLPNASCLLAGYLPATTVLHILLMPNDYPLEYIIVDAVGTFLAIINMFLLLRMECTGKWQGCQPTDENAKFRVLSLNKFGKSNAEYHLSANSPINTSYILLKK